MTKIIPDIPKKKIEGAYNPIFPNWGFFSRGEIEKSDGKLLMLDLDVGRTCSLHCPTCYRRDSDVDDVTKDDLTYDELMYVIQEAKNLGLRSVKTCGVGEPTEHDFFLQFIRDLTAIDVGAGVFTKGHVIGDDKKIEQVNKKYGIKTAREFCNELYDLNVSFMLSFQSFYPEIQDKLVGKKGQTLIRNKALENLVNSGFNDKNPTRISLVNAPVLPESYNETFSIYKFARERNLYPIFAMSMVSGKQFTEDFRRKIDLTDEQKLKLFTQIYSWNIENGFQTLEQIKEEGISSMPGAHPCNQNAVGLYVTMNGNVVRCPGSIEILGNVKEKSITQIWEEQKRNSFAGRFNCGCPYKEGITIPLDLYEKVLANLEKRYK